MTHVGDIKHFTGTGAIHSGLTLFVGDHGDLVLACPTDGAAWELPKATLSGAPARSSDAVPQPAGGTGPDVADGDLSLAAGAPDGSGAWSPSFDDEGPAGLLRELQQRGLV